MSTKKGWLNELCADWFPMEYNAAVKSDIDISYYVDMNKSL
jgi:hypothetical protein